MSKESKIIETIQEQGGIPPFTVWSCGFKEIIDGRPEGGMPPHPGTYHDINSAVNQYLELVGDGSGKGVLVTEPEKIVDSRGIQVYP